jgi:hypothetical protein
MVGAKGTSMLDTTALPKDPSNAGHVLGWGVFRRENWHLAGVHAKKEAAEAQAGSLGGDYEFAYGSHREGSDDFVANTE